MSDSITFALVSLASMTPLLIVYAVGIALGIAYLRRAPLPALLAITACAVLLLTSIASSMAFAWLGAQSLSPSWTPDRIDSARSTLSFSASAARTLGTAILLAAVFAARPKAP